MFERNGISYRAGENKCFRYNRLLYKTGEKNRTKQKCILLVITDRDRMRRRAGRRKVFLHCINIQIMMPAHWQNFMESVLRLVDLP